MTTVDIGEMLANCDEWLGIDEWRGGVTGDWAEARFGNSPAICSYDAINTFSHLVIRDTFTLNELEELRRTDHFEIDDCSKIKLRNPSQAPVLLLPNSVHVTPAIVLDVTLH